MSQRNCVLCADYNCTTDTVSHGSAQMKALCVTPFLDENLLKEDYTGPGPVLAWYTQDGLGSVRQLVVGDSAMNSYTYTAWGIPLQWRETIHNRYTFTGREYNPETALYHYRTREYMAKCGSFATRDPTNSMLYFYVRNNPAGFVDPTGLKRLSCIEVYKIAQRALSSAVPPKSKFAKYIGQLSPEVLTCLFFKESSFRTHVWNRPKTRFGLGQIGKSACLDVDREVVGEEDGTTWRKVRSEDAYEQVLATVRYLLVILYRLEDRWPEPPTKREVLRHYHVYRPTSQGLLWEGYVYADLLLDCEKCLKTYGTLTPQICRCCFEEMERRQRMLFREAAKPPKKRRTYRQIFQSPFPAPPAPPGYKKSKEKPQQVLPPIQPEPPEIPTVPQPPVPKREGISPLLPPSRLFDPAGFRPLRPPVEMRITPLRPIVEVIL